jgi:hypothetical protein
MITGVTNNSRVAELKKYAVNVPFNQQYVGGGNWSTDGVDFTNSISGVTMTYYIGGVKYIDTISTSTTVFNYTPQSQANFISTPYIKNTNEENIISIPKIYDDVFIIRQELSAFDKNYRLEYIKSLVDLTTYAGGKFFNIINNT